MLYQQALGDLSSLVVDQVDTQLLDQAEQHFLLARQMAAAENSSIIAAKMGLALAQVQVVRYYLAGDASRLVQAEAELEKVVAGHSTGELRVNNLAGHAHPRLALIAELRGDSQAAAAHYQQAIALVGPHWQVRYLLSLAGVYAAAADIEAAQKTCQAAMLRAESLGDKTLIQAVEETLRGLTRF